MGLKFADVVNIIDDLNSVNSRIRDLKNGLSYIVEGHEEPVFYVPEELVNQIECTTRRAAAIILATDSGLNPNFGEGE